MSAIDCCYYLPLSKKYIGIVFITFIHSTSQYEEKFSGVIYSGCNAACLCTKNIHLVRHADRWNCRRAKKEHDHRDREK